MSLTILDTIIDEEFRTPSTAPDDEHEVSAATFAASSFGTAVGVLSLNLLASPTGFPQYAERTNFVSSTNTVTNYFLTSNGSGDPFPAAGTATTLYVGSNQIFLFATADPNIVVGRIGNGTTADPTGAVAIIIGLEETVSGGVVTSADMWLVLRAPLIQDGQNLVDSADELDLTGLIYLGSDYATATEVPFENFAGVAPGNNLFNVIFPSDGSTALQLLLTGSAGETLQTVNVSTTGIGAGSQHIDVGSTLRIDIVTGMIQANVNEAPEVNQSANIDYANRVEIVGADFEVSQVNPGNPNERVDIRISAFNAAGNAQEASYLTDAIAADGTPVEIDAADVRVLNGAGVDITTGLIITQDGNSVIVRGLDDGLSNSSTDGWQVFFTTDGVGFDRLLITNIDGDGSTLDVANIHVITLVGGSDTEYAELGSHLIYQDDGSNIDPSGASVTALTADETTLGTDPSGSFAGLFGAPDYGADGAGSLTYLLGINSSGASSGLRDTATNNLVFLFLESGVVVGREGTNAADAEANGDIVFQISVASDGTVTLDQQRAVVHGTNPNPDESTAAMAASLITLSAKVEDSEGTGNNDSDTATVNVGDKFLFKDDGPVITAQPMGSGTPNNLELANTNGASDSSAYTLAPGADGLGSFIILGPADNSGTFRWTYDDASMTSITGTFRDALNVDHDLYTLVLNSNGTYTFTMIGELPGATLDLSPAEVIKAGSPDAPILEIGAAGTDDFVRMSADSSVGNGNINESHGFVGCDNGNLDAGESLTFTLHKANGDPLTFEGIQIGTKSAQGGVYNFEAHIAGGGTVTGQVTVGKNGTIIIDSDDLSGETIDSITITKVSGPATKIGIGDIHIIIPPNDVQLGFTVRETDGDGDWVNASFTVDIDGNLDGNYDANVNALSVVSALKNAGYTSDSGMAPAFDSARLMDAGDMHSTMKVEALNYLHQPDYYMV